MDQTRLRFEDVEPEQTPVRGAPGGTAVSVLLLIVSVLFLGWAGLSLAGYDSNRYAAALVALTEYAVPVGAVITLLALVLRRWLTTLVVGLVTAALVASVAPRAIPDSPRPVQGFPLRVLSANLYLGEADAARIVQLVRDNQVDVLSLPELTPQAVANLDRAGLARLMPHRVFDARPSGMGTGIASRLPLRPLSLVPPTTMSQPSALIDLPGPKDVQLVAAHPNVPVRAGTNDAWSREIQALPDPLPGGPVRMLAGDFNATLDHTPLKALIGRGYTDAAEVTGGGLAPTWPVNGAKPTPPVTIDHVLVSGASVVQDYRTFPVAGSDHRAVFAHVVIPD